jgi:hypothetical protein
MAIIDKGRLIKGTPYEFKKGNVEEKARNQELNVSEIIL